VFAALQAVFLGRVQHSWTTRYIGTGDVYVFGCPPKPEGIMVGILKAAEVLELKRKGVYQKDVVKITETGGVL